MPGFEPDIRDCLTFSTGLVAAIAVIVILSWIAGLPWQIAIARKHPEAEAVKIMDMPGSWRWCRWIQAFIRAFKPNWQMRN